MASRELSIRIRAENAVRKGIASATAAFKRFGARVRKIGGGITKALKKVTRGVLAIGVAMVAAVRHAHSFRVQMAEVSTMLDDVGGEMQNFTGEVLRLSREFGMAKATLARGLYDILSAGVPAARAIEFLTTATRAAIGGVTDTATAVDALTTVINAYGKSRRCRPRLGHHVSDRA